VAVLWRSFSNATEPPCVLFTLATFDGLLEQEKCFVVENGFPAWRRFEPGEDLFSVLSPAFSRRSIGHLLENCIVIR
jgi:hypothetical protein